MKTKFLILVSLALLILFSCQVPFEPGSPPSVPAQPPATGEFVPNEIIIKVSDALAPADVDLIVNGSRQRLIGSFGGFSYYVYIVTNRQNLDQQIDLINASGLPVHAEKNYFYQAYFIPNDPYYASCQYAPRLTSCEAAWDAYTGSPTTIVAVVDTGVNGQHEDVAGRVIAGYCTVYGGFPLPEGLHSDDHGHGTHVAGIIGAQGNNGKGIVGLAWQAKIMPVKVLDNFGYGSTAQVTEGILWAADHGAHVINMSMGGFYYSTAMGDAIAYAINDKNVTVVAAMGNDSMAMINYPAGYPGVIAVGSTNGRDELSSFSTTGSHISVTAPGENIMSLLGAQTNTYFYLSGTSMSAPFVAGLAALLHGKNNALTPAEIRSIIEDSADDKGQSGFDPRFGWGRVNVAHALSLATRNNYGTIKVTVTEDGAPLANWPVTLLNAAGTNILGAGTTSDGSALGGTAGQIIFSCMRAGSYLVRVSYPGSTKNTGAALTPESTETVLFDFSTYMIETFKNAGNVCCLELLLYDTTATYRLASGTPTNIIPYGYYRKIKCSLVSGRTYYVRIRGLPNSNYNPLIGYYSILLNQSGGGSSSTLPAQNSGEPDDTPAQAGLLALDTVANRYLSDGDVDWFYFIAP